VFYVLKKSGARVPLCGSVDDKLIVNHHAELASLLGARS
jgi:hypothetical protein